MKKIVRYGSVSSYRNLASYFKEMASKGYLISFVQNGVHYFDIVNPVDLDFEVIIFNEFDLSIYGDRKKYIDDMKKKGWKYVLKNDKIIVFCRKSTEDILCHCDNDRQQYEMVKSVWNRNKLKKILSILIALFIYVSNVYDHEFTRIYISNNFIKIVIPLMIFLIFIPIFGKTPYWIYKNKKNIYKGKKLYHRTKRTDKLLDLYLYFVLYFVLPIIIIIQWFLLLGGGDYIGKAITLIILFIPVIAYVIFNSNYFRSLKLKRIRFAIYFAVFSIYLFLVYMVGYYFVSNAVK